MQEFNFDKFMDDLVKREQQKKLQQEKLQRDENACDNKKRQKRYQERPANRIRYDK